MAVSALAQRASRCAWYVPLALCVGAAWLAITGPAQAAGFAVDASVATHQGSPSSSITSGTITTSAPNELVVAFITSDGPTQAGGQTFSSVSGGNLTWKLRERSNTQAGTAEIWAAAAPNPFTTVAVTATRSSGAYGGSIKVVALAGADTGLTGAVGGASAASGAPSVSLTSTRTGSWVWGVGNDWDRALARTVGGGQTLSDQYLAPAGDTYWVQSQTASGNTAGSSVTLNDTAPTGDRWDFAAIEILPAIADTTPPTAPTNLSKKILAERERTEGERKLVTALFTDIVGSTSLA